MDQPRPSDRPEVSSPPQADAPGASPCPYLPERVAVYEGLNADWLGGELYLQLMNLGCRRTGKTVYRMACGTCRECVPIRVPVAGFRPSRSQRRCWLRNRDITAEVAAPQLTDEKRDLYHRYVALRHQREEETDSLEETLYSSCVPTVEMTYRDAAGKLLAVGVCDVCPGALSSVYCYFDPEQPRRGLGTYTCLWEIDYARRQGLDYYYLGYWIRDCRAMRYKSCFRPQELLIADQWQPADRGVL